MNIIIRKIIAFVSLLSVGNIALAQSSGGAAVGAAVGSAIGGGAGAAVGAAVGAGGGSGFVQDVGTMMIFFAPSAQSIFELALVMCYVIGIYLAINAVLKLAEATNNKQLNPRVYIVQFLIAGVFMAMPEAITTIKDSMALTCTNACPGDMLMPDPNASGIQAWQKSATRGLLIFLKMIGIIAFIRGWLMLNKAAIGGQDGLISRGLTHIFGGCALMYMQGMFPILAASFGWKIQLLV